jgi:hypothetical protein
MISFLTLWKKCFWMRTNAFYIRYSYLLLYNLENTLQYFVPWLKKNFVYL